MTRYIDASVIIRNINKEPGWINPFLEGEKFIVSRLAKIECRRTFQRYHSERHIDDSAFAEYTKYLNETFDRLTFIDLTESILDRAEENWGTVVGSLDAIHLASALIYRSKFKESFQFLTHDKTLANAAKIQGFEVVT